MSFTLHGLGVSRGIASGAAHIIERDELEIQEYRVDDDALEAEILRLRAAVAQAHDDLRAIRHQIPADTPVDIAAFIDTHLLMLEDSALSAEAEHIIRESHCNAEWALRCQRDELVQVFDEMDDPYLRTRKDDIDHVVRRIQRILLNLDPLKHEVPGLRMQGLIILADDLTPSDCVLMQKNGVAGFVTEFGAPTSHASILARSLGIPGVVGVHHLRRYLRENEHLIVDGKEGVVIGEPDDRISAHYRAKQQAQQAYAASLMKIRDRPTVTSDGLAVELQANVELKSDFQAAVDVGATGVGLYRTEFLYMNRRDYPDEEEHFETYAEVISALQGAPATIRTHDLGADKSFGPVADMPQALNPALGLRAIRLALKEPSLFWPQLRAIVRASALGPVRLMVPMLSNVDECRQVIDAVRRIQADFRANGTEFDAGMPIGGMIEVPAAAVCADAFAEQLDFLSIGTNDLIQYTIAIDRLNDEVNYLYDPLNPAVLRLIAMILAAGKNTGTPVSMCGEMAGDTRYTRLLLGLGLREFSVPPSSLLEVKHAISQTRVSDIGDAAAAILNLTDPDQFKACLADLM
jgi:phosphotransferase system enzyme I (PtsI)